MAGLFMWMIPNTYIYLCVIYILFSISQLTYNVCIYLAFVFVFAFAGGMLTVLQQESMLCYVFVWFCALGWVIYLLSIPHMNS